MFVKMHFILRTDVNVFHESLCMIKWLELSSDQRLLSLQTISVRELILPGFSNTWTMNFQMFKLVLEKAEEPEIKLPTSAGSSKKEESSRKTSTSALLTTPKRLTVWITTNWKFLEEIGIQTTLPPSWEICMQVKKQQLELDVEQQTGSK